MKSIFGEFKYRLKAGYQHALAPLARVLGRRSRKKRRVLDVFLFYNELELLELRLAYLYPHVDEFVIAECGRTFAGAPKPLVFQENREKFSRFANKIRHVIIPDPSPSDWVSNPSNPKAPTSEFYQRDYLIHGIKGCAEDDIILVSDLDEILSSAGILEAIGYLSLGYPAAIFRQEWFVLFMNGFVYDSYRDGMDHPYLWFGPAATTWRNFKTAYQSKANHLWNFRWGHASRCLVRVREGGWHFSFMGGAQRIFQKVASEANRHLGATDLEELKKREFLGKRFRLVDPLLQFPRELAKLIQEVRLPLLNEPEFAKLVEQFEKNIPTSAAERDPK